MRCSYSREREREEDSVHSSPPQSACKNSHVRLLYMLQQQVSSSVTHSALRRDIIRASKNVLQNRSLRRLTSRKSNIDDAGRVGMEVYIYLSPGTQGHSSRELVSCNRVSVLG